jgi:hypothetical protein
MEDMDKMSRPSSQQGKEDNGRAAGLRQGYIASMRALIILAAAALSAGCDDGRRDVERRNAAYEAELAASGKAPRKGDPTMEPTPVAEDAELARWLACRPRKEGWPVDQRACDAATKAAEPNEREPFR